MADNGYYRNHTQIAIRVAAIEIMLHIQRFFVFERPLFRYFRFYGVSEILSLVYAMKSMTPNRTKWKIRYCFFVRYNVYLYIMGIYEGVFDRRSSFVFIALTLFGGEK